MAVGSWRIGQFLPPPLAGIPRGTQHRNKLVSWFGLAQLSLIAIGTDRAPLCRLRKPGPLHQRSTTQLHLKIKVYVPPNLTYQPEGKRARFPSVVTDLSTFEHQIGDLAPNVEFHNFRVKAQENIQVKVNLTALAYLHPRTPFTESEGRVNLYANCEQECA